MPEPFPLLRAGQRFRLHPACGTSATFKVLRVTACSATVRSLAAEHVVIPSPGDEGAPIADFWKPGRILQISPRSQVTLLADDEPTAP